MHYIWHMGIVTLGYALFLNQLRKHLLTAVYVKYIHEALSFVSPFGKNYAHTQFNYEFCFIKIRSSYLVHPLYKIYKNKNILPILDYSAFLGFLQTYVYFFS